ncbi:hypothetical protein HOP50_11g63240 [Chloropicon primus]|nr:hypothetical protein HOP50_11g63240 [Chloropicon primus]
MDLSHRMDSFGREEPEQVNRPKARETQERCMFCIELGKGVYIFTWVNFIGYCLSILLLGVTVNTVEWKAEPWIISALKIIEYLTGFVACIFGIKGIRERNANRLYIFAMYQVFLVGLSVLVFFITIFEYSSGHLSNKFHRICADSSANADDPTSSARDCDALAQDEALGELIMNPFSIALQCYFAYVVRRLYLIYMKDSVYRSGNAYEAFVDQDHV